MKSYGDCDGGVARDTPRRRRGRARPHRGERVATLRALIDTGPPHLRGGWVGLEIDAALEEPIELLAQVVLKLRAHLQVAHAGALERR
eukprot:4275556-Prymnesium_polylepis.1